MCRQGLMVLCGVGCLDVLLGFGGLYNYTRTPADGDELTMTMMMVV